MSELLPSQLLVIAIIVAPEIVRGVKSVLLTEKHVIIVISYTILNLSACVKRKVFLLLKLLRRGKYITWILEQILILIMDTLQVYILLLV